jgi:cyclopropane fatty-acyl-phospholipid synthase-like methyltransferase
MTDKPDASATGRNRQPILDVIKIEFRDCKSILEIGSGTGQHAVFFAAAMPWLTWQTSDLAECHPGIKTWIREIGPPNVLGPTLLDVERPGHVEDEYDGVFSANTAHIMGKRAVACMFDLVGHLLSASGVFCLYGPFNQNGEFSSKSNERFDQSLRSRDPAMGIRNLEDLDKFAAKSLLLRERLYAMPANNLLAVWRKQGTRE